MKEMKGQQPKKNLIADWATLQRIFIRPEDDASRQTLIKYMEQMLFGLHDFLNSHVGVTEAISLKDLTDLYKETVISPHPEKKLADVISDIIEGIAPRAVNVASPYFVGHMTAAIPFFMVHLKAIVAALNQNVIKLETSKVLSVLEKQVLAKIHRLIYQNSDAFYQTHVQHTDTSLGSFTTGGTTANLTALWVARNFFLKPFDDFKGVEYHGISEALGAYHLDRVVILASPRGHFSLRKAGGILGIGHGNVIPVDVDSSHRMDVVKLNQTIDNLKKKGRTGIVAVVGIAGATETGIVDPLDAIADVCEHHGIHFHVDAAWGGPVMLSEKYAHKLKGIERGDSVTIDGHKQFFMPMTCGMVYFRDPLAMDAIAYHANYVNRQGSVDLGIKTLEGSREANSLILDSSLKIMGTRGYGLMVDHGIETAREFSHAIHSRAMFEVVTEPELNILTYRILPPCIKEKMASVPLSKRKQIETCVDQLNIQVQRQQREAGRSFVSRTRIRKDAQDMEGQVVLRAVIMNPMTNIKILNEVLDEQELIANEHLAQWAGF